MSALNVANSVIQKADKQNVDKALKVIGDNQGAIKSALNTANSVIQKADKQGAITSALGVANSLIQKADKQNVDTALKAIGDNQDAIKSALNTTNSVIQNGPQGANGDDAPPADQDESAKTSAAADDANADVDDAGSDGDDANAGSDSDDANADDADSDAVRFPLRKLGYVQNDSQAATSPAAATDANEDEDEEEDIDIKALVKEQHEHYENTPKTLFDAKVQEFLSDDTQIDFLLQKDLTIAKAAELFAKFEKVYEDVEVKEELLKGDAFRKKIFENIKPSVRERINPLVVFKYAPDTVIYKMSLMLKPETLNQLDIDKFIKTMKPMKNAEFVAMLTKIGLDRWGKLDPDIMRAIPKAVFKELHPDYVKIMREQYRTAFYNDNYRVLLLFIGIVVFSNFVSYVITVRFFKIDVPEELTPKFKTKVNLPPVNWGGEDADLEPEEPDEVEEETPEPPANPRVTKYALLIHYALQAIIGGACLYIMNMVGFRRMRIMELNKLFGLYIMYQLALGLITLVGCYYEMFDDSLGTLIFGFPKSMLFSCEGAPDIDKAVLYHYVLFCCYFMMTLVVLYIFIPIVIDVQFRLQGRDLSDDLRPV